MNVYRIEGLLEDDGTHREVAAIIVCHNLKEASRLGRRILKDAYEWTEPGWARKPKILDYSYVVERIYLNEPKTLMMKCEP